MLSLKSAVCKQTKCRFHRMGEKVQVKPKSKLLSAEELISMRNVEIATLKSGLKRTTPSESQEEADELAKLYAQMRKQLSVPRIERIHGRSEGVWDPEQKAVKILRKEGKFDVFGYSVNGDHYLEYYEALFLLELNRLAITYKSMTVSIEQAYILLLGEQESTKYNNYLVYSMFSRVGYIVKKFQNSTFSTRKVSREDCNWAFLFHLIQKKPIPDYIRNSEHFADVEKSYLTVRNAIANQEPPMARHYDDEDEDSDPNWLVDRVKASRKRKAEVPETSSRKRARWGLEIPSNHKSLVDVLTHEADYKKFEEVFHSFNVIEMKPEFEYDFTEPSELEIQFDIYLHSDNFKKSELKPPVFRLVVLKKNQNFPNRTQISRCYHHQLCRVPVFVVSVSESKQIQAFLYHFT